MEITRLEELLKLKQLTQEAMKGKTFKSLPTSDKDRLLEMVCKLLNLID